MCVKVIIVWTIRGHLVDNTCTCCSRVVYAVCAVSVSTLQDVWMLEEGQGGHEGSAPKPRKPRPSSGGGAGKTPKAATPQMAQAASAQVGCVCWGGGSDCFEKERKITSSSAHMLERMRAAGWAVKLSIS